MKYAFTGRDFGLIDISLTEDNGNVLLTIADDGNGLPKGFDIEESNGFGLKLVKMLTQRLDGNFSIANNIGTVSVIRFHI